MFGPKRIKELPLGIARNLGEERESETVLNTHQDKFDEAIRKFGWQPFNHGAIDVSNQEIRARDHIATPVPAASVPYTALSTFEIIAQQQPLAGKIPQLAKIAIISWAIFNLIFILLWALRVI